MSTLQVTAVTTFESRSNDLPEILQGATAAGGNWGARQRAVGAPLSLPYRMAKRRVPALIGMLGFLIAVGGCIPVTVK